MILADRQTKLIGKVKNGDGRAFNQLVKDWYPRIYNFAWKYFSGREKLGSTHDLAAEVAQKTFIAVHRQINHLREANKFKSWLYRIAVNYCYEEDRQQKRRGGINIDEHEWAVSEAAVVDMYEEGGRGMEKREQSEWLLRALENIPAEQRVILVMKEYEGLKFREIADALSISENTAKSRLYYGLKAMRKVLDSWNINQETIHYEI